MLKFSKRFIELQDFFKKKMYTYEEALFLLKTIPPLNFNETIELHISLNIKKKESMSLTLNFPYPIHNKRKICVLVSPNEILLYKKLPLDILGSEELFPLILTKKIQFDILITTPTFMPKIIKLVKILGPQNLMPSQKTGTITYDIDKTISDINNGKYKCKSDKMNNFHIPFGKYCFVLSALKENLKQIFITLLSTFSFITKKNIKNIFLCSTMSPSLQISLDNLI